MVRAVSKNRTLHWLIAVFVALALATGYGAQQIPSLSGEFLRVHLAAGLLAGLLSLVRLAVWLVAGEQASTLAHPIKRDKLGRKDGSRLSARSARSSSGERGGHVGFDRRCARDSQRQ
jgi:cytochrome b subunit of formate dehydrogenase